MNSCIKCNSGRGHLAITDISSGYLKSGRFIVLMDYGSSLFLQAAENYIKKQTHLLLK